MRDTDITHLLQRWRDQEHGAESALVEAVYPVVRALAQAQISRSHNAATLQATELAHEAFMRITEQRHFAWQNRAHFYAIVARVIRRLLIDHLRERGSLKRGAEFAFVPLDEAVEHPGVTGVRDVDWLALDAALGQLGERDPEQAKLVELRYFAGLTIEEASEAMGCSVPTAVRMWRFARAWLAEQLRD